MLKPSNLTSNTWQKAMTVFYVIFSFSDKTTFLGQLVHGIQLKVENNQMHKRF